MRVTVRGRVQGVWYRGSTRERAQELGLLGWVRNRPDGSVELIAQGPRDAVERLVEWCQRGPPGAYVSDLQQNTEPIGDELTDFRVSY